jgi:diguanylate cyclase
MSEKNLSKRIRFPQKKSTGKQPPDAIRSALLPDSAVVTSLADWETMVRGRKNTVFSREAETNRRKGTAGKCEKLLRDHKRNSKAKAALSVPNDEQLREANENLVVAAVKAMMMKDAAEQATVQMAHMAEHDVLTGLPNRALLADRLAQSITLAQRHDRKLALMYLDLDNFKRINDLFGHAVGDQLLRSVAKRLKGCVRLSDTISRQGGDEFVALMSEVEEVRDAILIAEKFIKAMTEPHFIDGHRLRVNLSIGISVYPDDGKDAEALFRNADTAMYHAKKVGRKNYQMFTSGMNDIAVNRQSVEKSLRHALEHRQFVLHYQPKVNLETGAITGAEALIRLQPSNHQLVYPTKFVNIAEECGLILPIGKWALREACRQTKTWLQAGLDIGQIAVNVSAKELHNLNFIEGVLAVLDETGLAPGNLELEVTESGLMEDMEQTMTIFHSLKDIGIRVAVDDFGTGYSSLSLLLQIPIDTIKIDRSFVEKINGNDGEAVINAAIAIGKSLKQRVVAEGIETQQQLTLLKSSHCAEGQGYYFGRPMAADEFTALLASDRH